MPKLAAKEYCTGCTACASVCPKGCIAMTADENGFLCPVIDAQMCVRCGLCEKTCPVITPPETVEKEPRAYAAYSKDEAMRMDSSSGGIFSELAQRVLNDGGAVFGASYNERFDVVHICVENKAELSRLRGAKYAQSNLHGIFVQVKQRLENGQYVLFSGTPCQVVGLKAFLRKDYENLLSVDFVCHSVPSPMVWREYIKHRADEDNGGQLPRSINLRSKTTGWSHYRYSNRFEYKNGSCHTVSSSDSLYMKLFVGGYISRESCATCSFKGFSRVSDITLGDFWGIWDIAPEMDNNKGTSLVILHSEKGRQLFHSLSPYIVSQPFPLDACAAQNPAILHPAQPSPKREQALSIIRDGRIGELSSWFKTPTHSLHHRILRKLKQLWR